MALPVKKHAMTWKRRVKSARADATRNSTGGDLRAVPGVCHQITRGRHHARRAMREMVEKDEES